MTNPTGTTRSNTPFRDAVCSPKPPPGSITNISGLFSPDPSSKRPSKSPNEDIIMTKLVSRFNKHFETHIKDTQSTIDKHIDKNSKVTQSNHLKNMDLFDKFNTHLDNSIYKINNQLDSISNKLLGIEDFKKETSKQFTSIHDSLLTNTNQITDLSTDTLTKFNILKDNIDSNTNTINDFKHNIKDNQAVIQDTTLYDEVAKIQDEVQKNKSTIISLQNDLHAFHPDSEDITTVQKDLSQIKHMLGATEEHILLYMMLLFGLYSGLPTTKTIGLN